MFDTEAALAHHSETTLAASDEEAHDADCWFLVP